MKPMTSVNSYKEEKKYTIDKHSITYQKDKTDSPLSTFVECMNDLNMHRH